MKIKILIYTDSMRFKEYNLSKPSKEELYNRRKQE